MANTLKIYKTQITPARNALLDDIEGYLEHIERKTSAYTGDDALTYTESDFQFVKPDLDVNIKIAVAKNNNNLFDSIGNYARIEQSQDDGTRSVWYYFIIGSKWTAKSTLELTLSMDTVNTFSEYILNEDNWSDKTNIIREHKDRFKKIGDATYVKNIDRTGESITVPYYVKTNDTKIEEPNSTGTPEWYLVYKTENKNAEGNEGQIDPENPPLACYVYPKTPIIYSQQSGTPGEAFRKEPSDFDNGKIYGIVDGGVSFSDLTISAKYWNSYENNMMVSSDLGIPALTSDYDWGAVVGPGTNIISGHVRVGETFNYEGHTYTCYAVVWFKESGLTGNGLNLPIGLFKSTKDNSTYYAVFVEKYNNVIVNKWLFHSIMQFKAVGRWVNEQILGTEAAYSKDQIEVPLYVLGFIKLVDERAYRLEDTSTTTPEDGTNGSKDTNWARNGIIFSDGELAFDRDVSNIYELDYKNKTPSALELANGNVFYRNVEGGEIAYISCIDFLDKTDPTLVKVLALPYCPTEISVSSSSSEGTIISFDPNILTLEREEALGYTDYQRLKYTNINASFGKNLLTTTFDYSAPRPLMDYLYKNIITDRSIENETKLLHSDYYKDTFVYDNVSKVIRREDVDPNGTEVYITPYYKPTNTINSTMMYKFNVDNANYKQITDWDNILISTRSNEIPIYNNEYLNYLKYGYGAEKANLEASAEAQRTDVAITQGLSVGGGTLGGAFAGAKIGLSVGGPWGGVVGGVLGGVVGLATGLITAWNVNNKTETSIENAQRSLSSKVDQLQHSAQTVRSGFSDIDLMTEYSGNRLHLMTYDTIDLLKDAIYDRFFYCGYSSPTQARPNLYSRKIFNFIQCNPVFKDESTNVYNYYIADIKDRFNSGITIYHNASSYIDDTELMYNWNQNLENWETFERQLPTNFDVRHEADDSYFGYIDYKNVGYYDTTSLVPSADNNFRYKITYQIAGSPDRFNWRYDTLEDLQNGYTLNKVIDLTKLDAFNLAGNGTKIYVKVIDITGEWKDSNEISITLNQTICETSTEAMNLVLSKNDYFYDENSETDYWIWRRGVIRWATTEQFPQIGDTVYNVSPGIVGGPNYAIGQPIGTVSKFTAFAD